MNTAETWHDYIVAEIHATRELLADQYHHDFLAYSKANHIAVPWDFTVWKAHAVKPFRILPKKPRP